MKFTFLKYYLVFVIFAPFTLYAQIHNTKSDISDTTTNKNLKNSLYINNQIKSDQFYDTLYTIASKNNITKAALGLLLVNEPKSGKYIGIEDVRNEEYYNLYRGKTIRNIEILKLDIFGPTFTDTSNVSTKWLDRFGNNTHVKTREFIIRNNLFFTEGDSIDPILLTDNERLLRSLNYLKDASIQIAEIPESPNEVDILIVTKDVYSAGFYVDLQDLESGIIEIYENNLAGVGHKFQGSIFVNSAEDPPTGYEFNYTINNIAGSFIKSNVNYIKAFETERIGLELSRNFYNYKTKWAGGIKIYQNSTVEDIKKTDTTLNDVRLNYSTQDIWLARAFLIGTKNWQYTNKTRLVFGIRYINNNFRKGPEVSERYNFQYHDNQILLGSFAFSRQRYYKSNLIYGFGTTEDIPIGCLAQLNLGLEKDEFFKRPYFGLRLSRGIYYPKIGYLNLHAEFGGLYYQEKLEQGVINFSGQAISNLHYYNRLKLREFLSFNYTRGINRFSDEKIYFNKDDIGGLSSDYLFGFQKLSFRSEIVVFSNIYLYNFRLLFLGFGDLGFIGSENKVIFNNKLYSGIGLGVRVRNENLVFKTFQLRLAYYPIVPKDVNHFNIFISGENTEQPINFEPTQPNIVNYE